jgi:signal transduction histidine kinase
LLNLRRVSTGSVQIETSSPAVNRTMQHGAACGRAENERSARSPAWHARRTIGQDVSLFIRPASGYMEGQARTRMGRALFGWYQQLSLRARFTFHITASTLVLFAGLVPAVVYLERRAVLGGAWDRGLQLTKIFAHASVQGLVADDFLVVRHVINSVASQPDVLRAMIVDPSGKILAHSDIRQTGQMRPDALSARALAAELPLGEETAEHGAPAYEFAVPVYVLTEPRAVARVSISLERELAEIRRTRNLIVGLGGLALVAGFGVAAWQAHTVTRPLGALVQGARDIAAGDLAKRIATHGAAEVDQLATAFNRMAESLEARIAELRGAQHEVVRKTRLAAIGEIAAVMAHETRNPLGAVSNCVQILRKHAGLSPDDVEVLEIIKGETDRLTAIVSDFLAYGRPRAPVFQAVDVHDCIEGALRLLQRDDRCTADIAIERDLRASPALVRADPGQLRQVFWNVLLNAVQAMGDAGVLRVASHTVDGFVHVTVRDTGRGIPASEMSRLFEPFQTRRPGGIGLGLATVRRIVDEHGGRVSLHSEPGIGTRVVIELPHAG